MSSQPDTEKQPEYQVVVNHQEQYSVWLAGWALPLGWTAEGTQGTKDECLAHIETVWT